jgi:hypothetical protein
VWARRSFPLEQRDWRSQLVFGRCVKAMVLRVHVGDIVVFLSSRIPGRATGFYGVSARVFIAELTSNQRVSVHGFGFDYSCSPYMTRLPSAVGCFVSAQGAKWLQIFPTGCYSPTEMVLVLGRDAVA